MPDSPMVGFRLGSNAPSVNRSSRLWGKNPRAQRGAESAPPARPARPAPGLPHGAVPDQKQLQGEACSVHSLRCLGPVPPAAEQRRSRWVGAIEALQTDDTTAPTPRCFEVGHAGRRRQNHLTRLRLSGGGRAELGGHELLRWGISGWPRGAA